jgi:hypothetical protein
MITPTLPATVLSPPAARLSSSLTSGRLGAGRPGGEELLALALGFAGAARAHGLFDAEEGVQLVVDRAAAGGSGDLFGLGGGEQVAEAPPNFGDLRGIAFRVGQGLLDVLPHLRGVAALVGCVAGEHAVTIRVHAGGHVLVGDELQRGHHVA